MRDLAGSVDVGEQVLALDVLGQIGWSAGRPLLEETLPVVVASCESDDVAVLDAAIIALGHLGDARGLDAVMRHAAHPADEVRFAVAVALPSVAGDPPARAAITALVALTTDPDAEVRDWATFGLSSVDVDSDAIRDALAARLADPDGDTADEAVVGLARRRDRRALPMLLARLGDRPGNLVVEAAAELGAREALPALLRLKAEGWQDGDPSPSVLDEAMRACSDRRSPLAP